MTDYKLAAEPRIAKAKKIKNSGRIPAIVYGKHSDNEVVSLDKITFNQVFKEAGTSNLIELTIGDQKPFKTLIHDLQKNPMTEEIIHIDFFKVNMKEKIHAEVPLTFVGDSAAVVDQDGSMITPMDAIEVECLPADLPSEIEIDISILDDFEKSIKVSDLKPIAGVEFIAEPEEVIVFVQAPRSEEELAELDEAVEENVDAVEVENKGEETPEGEAEEETEKKSE